MPETEYRNLRHRREEWPSGWDSNLSKNTGALIKTLMIYFEKLSDGRSRSMEPDITLILPAYNEAARIENTISEAISYFRSRNLRYEIIVAADGSDGTREKAAGMARTDPAIRVIGEQARRGKGRGIRDAVRMANGKIIGFADADNKVPIDEFDKISAVLEQGVPVVIGSRALQNSLIERSQPLHRRLGSWGFGIFMHATVGLNHVRDTQCGFKFFPREVARELFTLQKIDGYMFDVEILAIATRLGFEIREVPIRWRDDGDSRLNLVAGNIRNGLDVLKICLSVSRIRPTSAFSRAYVARGGE
jgi:dolichyl-phosphate beta-glucosyltransferase